MSVLFGAPKRPFSYYSTDSEGTTPKTSASRPRRDATPPTATPAAPRAVPEILKASFDEENGVVHSCVVAPAAECAGAPYPGSDIDTAVSKLATASVMDKELVHIAILRRIFGADADRFLFIPHACRLDSQGPRAQAAMRECGRRGFAEHSPTQLVSKRVRVLGVDFDEYAGERGDDGEVGLGFWTTATLGMLASVFRSYQRIADTEVDGVHYAYVDFNGGQNVVVDVDEEGAPTGMRIMDFDKLAVGTPDLKPLKSDLLGTLQYLGFPNYPVPSRTTPEEMLLLRTPIEQCNPPSAGGLAAALDVVAGIVQEKLSCV